MNGESVLSNEDVCQRCPGPKQMGSKMQCWHSLKPGNAFGSFRWRRRRDLCLLTEPAEPRRPIRTSFAMQPSSEVALETPDVLLCLEPGCIQSRSYFAFEDGLLRCWQLGPSDPPKNCGALMAAVNTLASRTKCRKPSFYYKVKKDPTKRIPFSCSSQKQGRVSIVFGNGSLGMRACTCSLISRVRRLCHLLSLLWAKYHSQRTSFYQTEIKVVDGVGPLTSGHLREKQLQG